MNASDREIRKDRVPPGTDPGREADLWRAFVDSAVGLEASGSGLLDGLTFAVKDVFDIQGVVSGAGSPDWLRTHGPAVSTALALLRLLANGARLEGTTQTDEMMYSLNGENAHYGTPVNPAAPDRIPGGSSSGSAVAAAAGLVDFAVGTDTGGSVRIPSSYCGIYGFRPTHGAVCADGVVPLARSFDTVGWMSRDPGVLLRAGRVLLGRDAELSAEAGRGRSADGPKLAAAGAIAPETDRPFARFFAAEEAWALPEESDRKTLLDRLRRFGGWQDGGSPIRVTEQGDTLVDWSAAFRILQGLEIAREHGEWIERERPVFGPGIAERFEWARALDPSAGASETQLRAAVRSKLTALLGNDGLLAIPTAPGPAPLLGLRGAEAETYRAKVMQLSCMAGLSGLPQITVPVLRADGLPLGLSFIAGPNADLKLLRWTAEQFEKEVRR
ncbi:amidase family protein [Saccharibacillus alkalitolerans]|uniref:Amidase n=1 Tax=Saccharibacillus alkalitolerans TaxID=2705290 RepID=A0ABX0F4C5_9BACL|nr:amidase family protein [Saccharibacillus alkalitolerans]NGZ74444.1 amidase [Saccharibacillus alkalitolerans]